MSVSTYQKIDQGYKLAYVHSAADERGAGLPAVMFLGGFKSDMEGTKAIYLEEQCKARGQEFVRFDYSGHGVSGGDFEDGTISSWAFDAADILEHIVQSRRVILVGSSMGGWIALLLMLKATERVCGVIGIAAAPDFSKDVVAKMSDEQKEILQRDGRLEVPNDYSDEPYVFTKALIDDGNKNCLLDQMHDIDVPLVLLQGRNDEDVHYTKALQIAEVFRGTEVQVTLINEADHRLSRDEDLVMLDSRVRYLSGL